MLAVTVLQVMNSSEKSMLEQFRTVLGP